MKLVIGLSFIACFMNSKSFITEDLYETDFFSENFCCILSTENQ